MTWEWEILKNSNDDKVTDWLLGTVFDDPELETEIEELLKEE
jgi:hypothetical protein